jgi:hypothetical protein
MSDEHARRLDDIEKRLQRVEASIWPLATAYAAMPKPSKHVGAGEQWCECGRDVCRAPDCPSHKADPLGR